jgi:glycosyltransferase involved in cell wall biosynthesis
MLDLGAKPEQLLVNKNCVDNKSIREIYDKAKISRAEKQLQLGLAKKNFIFVGRLIPFKNLPLLLEAFNEALGKSKGDWGLILLGEGEQKAELEKIISDNNFQGITFLPSVGWRSTKIFGLIGCIGFTKLFRTLGLGRQRSYGLWNASNCFRKMWLCARFSAKW